MEANFSFSKFPPIFDHHQGEQSFSTQHEMNFILQERKKFKDSLRTNYSKADLMTNTLKKCPSSLKDLSLKLNLQSLKMNHGSNTNSQFTLSKLQQSSQRNLNTNKTNACSVCNLSQFKTSFREIEQQKVQYKQKTKIEHEEFKKNRKILIIFDNSLVTCNSIFKLINCRTFSPFQNKQDSWKKQILSQMNVHAIKTYIFNLKGHHVDCIFDSRENVFVISNDIFFPGIQNIKDQKFKSDLEEFIQKQEKELLDYNSNIIDYHKIDRYQMENLVQAKQNTDLIYSERDYKFRSLQSNDYSRSLERIHDIYQDIFIQILGHLYQQQREMDEKFKKQPIIIEEPKENTQEEHIDVVTDLLIQEFGKVHSQGDSDQGFNFDLIPQRKQPTNFIKNNISQYNNSYKSILQQQQQFNTDLFLKNIPEMLKGKDFTRKQLFEFYALFKILSQLTAVSKKDIKKNGVDFDTYFLGIQENFVKGYSQSKIMFNNIDKRQKGVLDQRQFMDLIFMLRDKSIENKIDMFFKTANTKKLMTKEEVLEQCKFSLSAFIDNETLLNSITRFFTSHIYQFLGLDESKDKLDLMQLKDRMLIDTEENQKLVSIFFGI